MAEFPYLKWYPTDFHAKTAHLTPMAELAYRRLLEFMWLRGGWLDLDHPALSRLAHCDPKNWQKIWVQIEPFLIIENDRISQSRILEDLTRAASVSDTKRQSGKSRYTKKANNIKASGLAYAKHMSTSSDVRCHTTPVDIESTGVGLPHLNGAAHPPEKKTKKNGTRLPEDWKPAPEIVQFAYSEGLTRDEAQREYEKFCDYWDGKSGKDATKLDWDATFRNWLRRASDDKKNRQARQQQSGKRWSTA